MELNRADFEAKAMEVQSEISQQLTRMCIERGNKHLPPETVNDVFHKAMSYYLQWAYMEGVKVHTPKIMPGSED